jgi:hypothetical protein
MAALLDIRATPRQAHALRGLAQGLTLVLNAHGRPKFLQTSEPVLWSTADALHRRGWISHLPGLPLFSEPSS